jgi:peptidoglycan/xylan/chitin deacetylase (PgdA/CDA1 family)
MSLPSISMCAAHPWQTLSVSQHRVAHAVLEDTGPGSAVWILMYHGITADVQKAGVTNYWRYNIHRDALEQHLAFLRKHCNPISLAELRAGSRLVKTKSNVVLSFDDGYESNYTIAFPLLKRYGIPAVFALPTAFVFDSEPLWNDIVEYAVNHSPHESVRFKWARTTHEFVTLDLAGRIALYKWLTNECVRVQQERRADLIDIAVGALGVVARAEDLFQYADYRPLTVKQIWEMAGSHLIEYASHSVHHYLLTKVRVAARQTELQQSKDRIEKITGHPCTTFSVPAGFYSRAVLKDVLAAGYELILTSVSGATTPGEQVLPRNVLLDGDDVQVLADMIGALHQ